MKNINDSTVYQVNDSIVVDIEGLTEDEAKAIAKNYADQHLTPDFFLEVELMPEEQENFTGWVFGVSW